MTNIKSTSKTVRDRHEARRLELSLCIAARALSFYEAAYPGDYRPRRSIEICLAASPILPEIIAEAQDTARDAAEQEDWYPSIIAAAKAAECVAAAVAGRPLIQVAELAGQVAELVGGNDAWIAETRWQLDLLRKYGAIRCAPARLPPDRHRRYMELELERFLWTIDTAATWSWTIGSQLTDSVIPR